MLYKLTADLVVLFHLIFILFAMFGSLLLLFRRWIVWLHFPSMCWAAAISFGGWVCPLTPIENYFRKAAGDQGYEGGFVQHYIIPVIYPEAYTRELAFYLGIGVLMLNALMYVLVLYRMRQHEPN